MGDTDKTDAWEPLDAEQRRMWGVFADMGYSADPIAIFRDKEDAERWLADDAARGDESEVCVDVCIIAVENLTGRVWNSTEDPPERTRG